MDRRSRGRDVALAYLPYCALIPLLGVPAWQLDGVFVGATRSSAMRNASIAAVAIYVVADVGLTGAWGASGTWAAFLVYYVARTATLAVAYPGVERHVRRHRRSGPGPGGHA